MYLLLLVVAGAAAVLSFAALRDLALICGFEPWLAWLLPVVVDAGAAAGSLVWLSGWSGVAARRFARSLALALLGLSVAANALGHGLAAFDLRPVWWVVVVVSAIAPAVLGAVVHLAVLVGRPDHKAQSAGPPMVLTDEIAELNATIAAAVEDGELDEHGLSRMWEHAPAASHGTGSGPQRAAVLIAAGAGRRRLSRELAISEYEARQLLHHTRRSRAPSTTDPDTDVDARTDDAAAARLHAVNGTGGPK